MRCYYYINEEKNLLFPNLDSSISTVMPSPPIGSESTKQVCTATSLHFRHQSGIDLLFPTCAKRQVSCRVRPSNQQKQIASWKYINHQIKIISNIIKRVAYHFTKSKLRIGKNGSIPHAQVLVTPA